MGSRGQKSLSSPRDLKKKSTQIERGAKRGQFHNSFSKGRKTTPNKENERGEGAKKKSLTGKRSNANGEHEDQHSPNSVGEISEK